LRMPRLERVRPKGNPERIQALDFIHYMVSRYELKDRHHVASPSIFARVKIFLLHFLWVMQQTRFDLFEKIRLLADVVNRCDVYVSAREEPAR
jgi:hypothetical protein